MSGGLVDRRDLDSTGRDRARPMRPLGRRERTITANIDLDRLAVRLDDEEPDDQRAVVVQIEHDAVGSSGQACLSVWAAWSLRSISAGSNGTGDPAQTVRDIAKLISSPVSATSPAADQVFCLPMGATDGKAARHTYA
jgi:hypothetical protein